MLVRGVLFVFGLVLCLASYQFGRSESKRDDVAMEIDSSRIEELRVAHEAEIMMIPGVVSLATGLNDEGFPCLKIGTSVPIERVRPLLPHELQDVSVELEYVGEIRAQEEP